MRLVSRMVIFCIASFSSVAMTGLEMDGMTVTTRAFLAADSNGRIPLSYSKGAYKLSIDSYTASLLISAWQKMVKTRNKRIFAWYIHGRFSLCSIQGRTHAILYYGCLGRLTYFSKFPNFRVLVPILKHGSSIDARLESWKQLRRHWATLIGRSVDRKTSEEHLFLEDH